MIESPGSSGHRIIDCLKTIGLDGALLAIDPDGACLMEIDDFTAIAGQPWASLWPVESQFLVSASIQQAVQGKVARFSANCPTAKGTPKSWEVTVIPIRNAGGEVVALQSLSLDVTRREHDRRETALVSRELSHRIQNLFAVVDGLIHLSSRTEPTARPFIDRLRQRLAGLGRAIAYINPIDGEDVRSAPRTLKGLITALMEPYMLAGAAITVEGDDADVGSHAVTSVALVLNELATNAVKYGAIKDASGQLTIHLLKSADMIILRWEERCAAGTVGEIKSGFGTSLLDRTIRFQLGGSIERDWSDTGLILRLMIPLKRLTEG